MILFLDTETTGLPPESSTPVSDADAWPRLVEVAWQTYSANRKQVGRNTLLVRPDGFEIPDDAVSIHGISMEQARDSGKELKAVLEAFNKGLGEVETIVAHNAWFDIGVLLAEFHRAGVDTPLGELPVICTMRSAADFCARKGTTDGRWPSLSTLHKTLTDREPSRTHRAAADVQTLVSCFWKLVAHEVVSEDQPGLPLKAAGRSVGEAASESVQADVSDTSVEAREIPPTEERQTENQEDDDETSRPEPQEGFVIDEVYERLQAILRDVEKKQEEIDSSESGDEAEAGSDQDNESLNILDAFYRRVGRFYAKGLPMTAPPDPVDPTIAVAYNYLCRGRPTRASLRLSEWMLDYYMPEAGATVKVDSTIGINIHSSYWNDVDAEALRDALEAPLESDLAELAGRIGKRPLQLLRLSRSLIHAAHVQIAIVWTLLQRGESIVENDGNDEFRVHMEGMEREFVQVVCDDLTTLLGHLSTLRYGSEPPCLRIRAVGEPIDAHLTIDGPWSHSSSEDESTPHTADADGAVSRQVKLIYPDNPEAENESQWPKRRVFADRINYLSIGEVQRYQDGDSEKQEFVVQDSDLGAAVKYILQNAFRKRGFWGGQEAIINRALQCKDVIGLLPTGGGKSLTYQLCGLLQPGTTVIVDPINSLMQDQYDKLCEEWMNASDYINSFYTKEQKKRVRTELTAGKLQFLFVAPERLQMPRYREAFEDSLRNGVRFSYGVVDEAHCVSEWGHDFRHVYLHLADNFQRFCTGPPRGPFDSEKAESQKDEKLPLFGLTATASFDVLADVQRELRMGEDAIITLPAEAIDRKELNFRILPISAEVDPDVEFYERERQLSWTKYHEVEKFIRTVPSELHVIGGNSETEINAFLAPNENGRYENAGVIFCPTKSPKLENGVLALRDGPKGKNGPRGLGERIPELEITTFFGGQDDDTVKNAFVEREAGKSLNNQRRFIRDQANLMIATKAFGMGIDKPNLRFTLHYSPPSSVENFYQEAGRAGRDGKPALCGILYHPRDIETNRTFQQNSFKGVGREKTILTELLEEVQYEDRFFVRLVERGVREQSGIYVRLNLFPNEEGDEPFLLYVNGEWHEDPAERVCYGCLHLDGLRPFKPGKYRKNVESETADRVLENTRTVLKQKSDTDNYAEYLTRVQAPGILPRLRKKDPEAAHELSIGFTSNTVQEMTAKLEEAGMIHDGKTYEVEDEIVRAAYNFSQDNDEFVERLHHQYRKYFDFNRELSLDEETEEFFRSNFLNIRNPTDTQRALYRLSILGIVDDYDIDYAGQVLDVRFKAKPDGEYRDHLEQYFRRYLGEDSTEAWLRQVDKQDEPSIVKSCLWIQTEFVYEEIARKRDRAIEYMDSLCQEGIERGESHFRQSIVYYFTSKYARDEYLPSDLDQGKIESLEVVDTYIEYVFNPPDGLGGQIDNAKHLRGACARLQTSLTGENAAIDVLTAFSVLVLNSVEYEADSGASVRPSEEAIDAYRRGFRSFIEAPSTSWGSVLDTMDRFHRRLSEISSEIEESIRPERDAFLVNRTTQQLAKLNRSLGI